MKLPFKIKLIVKMDEINKDYLNILVKPDKEYKEVIVNVKGKKYLVKIPIENVTYFVH